MMPHAANHHASHPPLSGPIRISPRRAVRERGAAAILAMMFLVIFASLATAMAIVSQGNLSTADAQIKIGRSLSAAETGMHYIAHRLQLATQDVTTTDGQITSANAGDLWDEVVTRLLDPDYEHALVNELHNVQEPYRSGDVLYVGPIFVGPNAPSFRAILRPHPIAGENYNSSRYDQAPYTHLSPAVSNSDPLDATWVRVEVQASDGPVGREVYRSVSMDFRIDKKIRFAVLSRSRVMIGQNVMIDGSIGSRFTETNLNNGHPIQMVSDFRGLNDTLNDLLDDHLTQVITNDTDGDNRLAVYNTNEIAGYTDQAAAIAADINNDGYIDEFDHFLNVFDTTGDGRVSDTELQTAASSSIAATQLLELIDTFGNSNRAGYNDGFIDSDDSYAKIQGELHATAPLLGWLDGAADGAYQDEIQGPIAPDFGDTAMTFESQEANNYSFGPEDFDVTTFRNMTTNDFVAQASNQAAQHDPSDSNSPQPLGAEVREEVPFGAAYPYDFFDRPVYENMTFTNVRIPKGTNALFKNCTFIGVTFVETETNNTDANFNYSGMLESNGDAKHADKVTDVNGVEVADTKTVANNIRFDNCTFEGAVVTDSPEEFTHTRNKLSFTGTTKFDAENSPNLTEAEKQLFKRSTILAPHYSVEMGTFIAPHDAQEKVELSGTIVAGLIDMRGQVKVNGTILTTFEPTSNTGPVLGDTSPQFNTTLGYFGSADGDLETELPTTGVGVIQIRYDPTIPLPDGINGPIEITPVMTTYTEGGAISFP